MFLSRPGVDTSREGRGATDLRGENALCVVVVVAPSVSDKQDGLFFAKAKGTKQDFTIKCRLGKKKKKKGGKVTVLV